MNPKEYAEKHGLSEMEYKELAQQFDDMTEVIVAIIIKKFYRNNYVDLNKHE